MTNCVHTVKYFYGRQKNVYMYSTFIFQRFQISLFKQSNRIIAETGRFYMSNVHDESMITRYKCPTRTDSTSLQKLVCDTSSKNKTKNNKSMDK